MGGLERVAGQAVAAAPDPTQPAFGRRYAEGDEVLGEDAGGDPDQLVGAAAGTGRPVCGPYGDDVDPDERQVGLAAAGSSGA